jgi:2-polyprenyl-3-methyl-5-hydroxy-6-metoxy-1,4-benzoquinol methylase
MTDADVLLAEQLAYYRARASEYLQGAGVEGVSDEDQYAADAAVRAALDAAAPLGEVLELACGPGTFTGELADRATSVDALDAAPEMLEIAQARMASKANIRFARENLFGWAPERRYDFVFFGFWLSHVPANRFASFWSAVASALEPAGRVMFVDDGHRTTEELIEGPESSTIERRLSDGRRFRAVKVALEPVLLEQALTDLGWSIEVRSLPGPFFLGLGGRSA